MKVLILDKTETFVDRVFTTPIIIKNRGVSLIRCSSENITGDKSIAVEIAVDDYTLHNYTCKNVGIGIIADGKNNKVVGCTVDGYREDAIRFCKDGAEIRENTIVNYIGSHNAHHDAIQFYSGDQSYHYSWKNRYVLGPILSDCKIIGNTISDDSPFVQGIFCSDGLLSNFLVTKNHIDLPNSNHSISIRGLQRGMSEVSNNVIVGADMRIEKARRDVNNIGGGLKVRFAPLKTTIPKATERTKYKYVTTCKRSWRTLWLKKSCTTKRVKI